MVWRGGGRSRGSWCNDLHRRPLLDFYIEASNRAGNTSLSPAFAVGTATLTHNLNITVVGDGTVTPNGGTYATGASVTLTATPAAGFHVSGWSGDADCSDGVVTMDGVKNCTATFIPDTVKVYFPIVRHPPTAHPIIENPVPVIVFRPAIQGETFYSVTVTLDMATLPTGGRFFFTGAPDQVQPIWVDDVIAVVKNGADLFSYDFGVPPGVRFKITPAAIEAPRAVVEEMAAGGTTLEYRDVYGGQVNASDVWFIRVP